MAGERWAPVAAIEFFQGKHFGLRQKRHAFCHAIDTSEIAAIGNRPLGAALRVLG
jgi:hypothetical protein